jgi:hypothetical protein
MEKIKELINIRKDISFFKTLSLIAVCFAILSMLIYAFFSYRMYQGYQQSIYVIDNEGKAFAGAFAGGDLLRTDPEVYDHVVNFHKLFFEIDQFNYITRVDNALNLIGDSGKQLFLKLKASALFSSLINYNVRQVIRIDRLDLNLKGYPYKGSIDFRLIHEAYDPKDTRKFSELRGIVREFDIYPVDRSRKNPHGLIIENYAPELKKY